MYVFTYFKLRVLKYIHARKLRNAIINEENAKKRVELFEKLEKVISEMNPEKSEKSEKILKKLEKLEKLEKIKKIEKIEEFVGKIIEDIKGQ